MITSVVSVFILLVKSVLSSIRALLLFSTLSLAIYFLPLDLEPILVELFFFAFSARVFPIQIHKHALLRLLR